ncbi:MAG TPA: YfhO family protein [Bacteroidales bacterium]
MLKENLKKLLPHAIAVLTFIVLSCIYFYPQLEGLQLRQSDTEQSIGMSKEISDFRTKYGKDPLWTNAAFCGMPAYQISTMHSNYVAPVEEKTILKLFPRPIGYILLAMIAFYILLLCFEVTPWFGIIGAVAFGLSSIFMLYLEAGHNSKVHAIALLPAVIGSLMLAYRKDFKIGAILLSFFLCLEISANHIQMTYYSLFLIACIVIVELIIHIKEKLFLKFIKVSSVLLVATVLAILPSFSNLYTTYEYGKYSTRGKSELTISPSAPGQQKQSTENALDPGYITQYSMGVGETWSVAIPNVKGGEETYLGNKKDVMNEVNPQYREYIAQQPSYWGEQLFSGGAFYFGATIFTLFILGLVFIKDPIKWAFLAASALGIMLSWKYSEILQFFINHFPWFNKFRDTKMMLILVQISFPLVGLLFLKEIFNRLIDKKKLLYTLLIINGIFLLFYIMPGTFFDFLSSAESENFNKQLTAYSSNPEYQTQFNTFISELEHARMIIFKKDVLRTLFFSLVVSGLVYFFVAGKVKKNYLLGSLGVLILLDLWLVDKRYLNNEEIGSGYKMWVQKQQYNNPYRASVADNFILNNELTQNPDLKAKVEEGVNQALANVKPQDVEVQRERLTFRELGFATDYRVLILPDPFSNGEVSYFHKSLGGYNGAKLKKYQELIDFYISDENSSIVSALRDSTVTQGKIDALLRTRIPVLNMLNTKYIIYNPGAAPFVNSNTNGNCWLVKDIKYVQNADEEMLSLGKVDLKATAVVNQKYKDEIQSFQYDSTASIKLLTCLPNHLVYKSIAKSPQFVVFSEIYYPKGWDAYVDGKKTAYCSANYVLRAMSVPAGEHSIEFRFEPKSYYVGEKISMASSILLIIILIGALSWEVYLKIKA